MKFWRGERNESRPPPVRGRFAIQRADLLWFSGASEAAWVAQVDGAMVFTDLDTALAQCARLKLEGHPAHVLAV